MFYCLNTTDLNFMYLFDVDCNNILPCLLAFMSTLLYFLFVNCSEVFYLIG